MRKRLAIGGFCRVQLLVDTLIEKFQPHPGNDGQTPKMEAILGKNGAVPCFAGVQITQPATLCIGCFTALVGPVLQRVIEVDTAGNGRDVVEQIVVMTNAGIDALCPGFAQLNRVCTRIWSAGQCAKPAAALTLAPARQIAAERLDLEFRPLREKLLVLEHGIVALELDPIEKSTGLSETVFHEDRVWRIYFFPATHAARLTMFFVVEIECEDEPAIVCHIPNETWAAAVK